LARICGVTVWEDLRVPSFRRVVARWEIGGSGILRLVWIVYAGRTRVVRVAKTSQVLGSFTARKFESPQEVGEEVKYPTLP